ncbi:MAG: N-acetylmuramoyl-L-alanine amidase [Deltaproteobacteria bacterium HGW-Deltaproteobacteria-4]|nr:MAG: N-acetylmuramoyl-L-alanine amidase [Deltaproteobacteria bacterium HGW-Deltaproteobacteria-4]
MKKHWTFFLLLLFFCTLLTPGADAAGKNPDKEFAAAKAALTRLDADKGKARSYRDRWVKVIADLESFRARHPRHGKSAEALYLAATAQEKMALISRLPGDFAAAQEAYLAVADAAPSSPYAADGLWAAARLTEKNLQDPAATYRVYERIKTEQGQSKYAGKAKDELKRLAVYAPKPAPKPPVVAAPPAPSAPLTPVVKGERGQLNGVRSWSNPGYTRIVIDLSQPTDYTSTLLAADPAIGAPPRLFLDLLETLPVGGLPESSVVNDGLLRQIRTGKPEVGRTRVVLDLLSFDNYKIFTLPDPFRIIIDIAGSAGTIPVTTAQPLPAADPIAAIVAAAPPAILAPRPVPPVSSRPSRRIVIDAGHGGKDPGAVGPSGLLEKDIVLSMALLLAEEVKDKLGWDVVLTRNDDTFIPLEERTALANKVGADLFVSLHVNASSNSAAHGVETYYLNFSKNEKAAAVAARENGTTLRAVSDLEQILFDLMAHSKIQESSRLASDIQHALIIGLTREFGEVKNLGVKQGPFYVLLGANMPSVLVEAAFLSNPEEETRLATRKYQVETTRAIIDGLRAYDGSSQVVAQQ